MAILPRLFWIQTEILAAVRALAHLLRMLRSVERFCVAIRCIRLKHRMGQTTSRAHHVRNTVIGHFIFSMDSW